MFSVTADFSLKELEDYINYELDSWYEDLIEHYKSAAKKFVDTARARTKSEGGFGNITWNLRSSIGYIITFDGKIIKEYFPSIKGGTEGEKTGLQYAREIALLLNEDDGLVLVIVAGMEYASLVEAKNKEVISNQSKGFPADLLKELN